MPPGLRLPFDLVPEGVPRRAVVIERHGGTVAVFFPPLLQESFVELLAAVDRGLDAAGLPAVRLQGGLPADEMGIWRTIGLSADPGVLEINLPACEGWKDYDRWMRAVTEAAEASGLRAWREPVVGMPGDTGGGNHLLWGGPIEDANPFFTRPGWVASILRYWHGHPSLAYGFTGKYVGRHSQAPRADESGWEPHDLDWAWSFLESLPVGDQRIAIAETIRHLQADVTGNAHRSEICFDKFWSRAGTTVPPGLIEFRAIGSLPRAGWSTAVALLWLAAGVRLLDHPCRQRPRAFGRSLHDGCLLPSRLWDDLRTVLDDVTDAGMPLDERVYRDIWDWRFPVLLEFHEGAARLTVRQALEPWPLMSDVPLEGSMTSRFIDTSLRRIELVANDAFVEHWRPCIGGRRLPMVRAAFRHGSADGDWLAGVRYRRSRLFPSLHPGIPCRWPLELDIVGAHGHHRFVLSDASPRFERAPMTAAAPHLPGDDCRSLVEGDVTLDLRMQRAGQGMWSA